NVNELYTKPYIYGILETAQDGVQYRDPDHVRLVVDTGMKMKDAIGGIVIKDPLRETKDKN
ncbi:3795_t:CDS:2, partial [Ambispora leptoticha]